MGTRRKVPRSEERESSSQDQAVWSRNNRSQRYKRKMQLQNQWVEAGETGGEGKEQVRAETVVARGVVGSTRNHPPAVGRDSCDPRGASAGLRAWSHLFTIELYYK